MADKREREAVRLLKTAVESLAPEGAAYFLPVVNAKGQGIPGLNIRVLPSGLKVWVHRYRFHGFQKAYTLGRFPSMGPEMAEKASRAVQVGIDGGIDPLEAKESAKTAAQEARKAAVSVADLAERFIADHIGAEVEWDGDGFKVTLIRDTTGKPIGNKESTAREHIRLIHRNILPTLGKVAVKDVDTSVVANLLFKIRKEHPTQSNRVRSVLSKMFMKAELWGLRTPGSNPARGQDRAPERKKERNLSDRELVAVGAALKEAENAAIAPYFRRKEGEVKRELPQALAALRLAMLAGMRKAEIIGDRYRGMPALTWADFDVEAGLLHVHHKSETRTGKKRTVYLCSAARRLLEALPHQLGNDHVIPGEKPGQSLVNLHAVWDRIRDQVTKKAHAEALRTGAKVPPVDISDVTIHDLRRTFASVGARLGYPELWLGGLLGHSATTVTQGYARVNGDPLREAVEAIGGRIAALLSGEITPEKEAQAREDAKALEANKRA
jgi:integrase